MNKAPIVLLLTAMVVCSCSSDQVVPQSLFALKEGLYWQYQVEGVSVREEESYIARAKNMGDEIFFELVEYGESYWVRNSELGQMEAINFYNLQHEDIKLVNDKAAREQVIFKFPAEIGETWQVHASRMRYEGLQEIETPAGKFDCHMYRISEQGVTYSSTCIAEGIGPVYSDSLEKDGSLEVSRLVAWGEKPASEKE